MTFREAYQTLNISYGYDTFAYRLQILFPNDWQLINRTKYIFKTNKQILKSLANANYLN